MGKPGSIFRTGTSGIQGIAIFTGILTLAMYQVSLFTADVEQKESTKRKYQNMGFSMVFVFVLFTFLSGFGPVRRILNGLLKEIVKP